MLDLRMLDLAQSLKVCNNTGSDLEAILKRYFPLSGLLVKP